MRLHILRFAFIATTAFIFASRSQASDNCKAGFTLCAPPGATSETTPQIGTLAFQDLYEDIVFSSLPPSSKSSSSTSAASLCCTTSLSCVLMVDLEIPFCYDRFTTNYFLPDGSYGTVASIPRLPNRPFKRHASHNLASCAVGGAYNSSSGDLANLITGQYTLVNGSTGNIYSNGSAPNTATLPMPSQYTASGLGSAIPASDLGNEITTTYTTTFPGTTSPPSTIPPSTIPASVTTETVIIPTLATTEVSGSMATDSQVDVLSTATFPGTTIPGSTMPGTTIPPVVATITTTEPSPTSTTKKNGSSKTKAPWIAVILGSALAFLMQGSH